MASLIALLGEKLKNQKEEVEVASLAKEGSYIGLYFSSVYCGPCKEFTPILIERYQELNKEEPGKLEIVYVSCYDEEESDFDGYYATMPWLAVPFSNKGIAEKLQKKLKVHGIPTLSILDATSGNVIRQDARSLIEETPEDFPWPTVPLSEVLKGPLLSKDGEVDASEALKGKIIALFLSRLPRPVETSDVDGLAHTYKKLKEAGKNFEVVFVDDDISEEEYNNHCEQMPWLLLPYEDKRRDYIHNHFRTGYTVILLDENYEVMRRNAERMIQEDPDGEGFPWRPTFLSTLVSSHAEVDIINNFPCVIYLTGGVEEETKKAKDMLTTISEEYTKEYKETLDPTLGEADIPEIHFYYESPESGDFVMKVRKYASFGEDAPLLALLDIDNSQKYVVEKDIYTIEDVRDIVERFKADALEMTEFGVEAEESEGDGAGAGDSSGQKGDDGGDGDEFGTGGDCDDGAGACAGDSSDKNGDAGGDGDDGDAGGDGDTEGDGDTGGGANTHNGACNQ